jgi:hypothetical protein
MIRIPAAALSIRSKSLCPMLEYELNAALRKVHNVLGKDLLALKNYYFMLVGRAVRVVPLFQRCTNHTRWTLVLVTK